MSKLLLHTNVAEHDIRACMINREVLRFEEELLPDTMGRMAPAPDGAKMRPFKVDERERRHGRDHNVGLDLAKSVFQGHRQLGAGLGKAGRDG